LPASGFARLPALASTTHSTPLLNGPSCRHWKELQNITVKELNLAEDVFKLQHLLDANLLARR